MSKRKKANSDYPSTSFSSGEISAQLVPAYTNVEIQGILTLVLRRLRHEPFSIEYVVPWEAIDPKPGKGEARQKASKKDPPKSADKKEEVVKAKKEVLKDWLGEPRKQTDILSGKVVASYTRFTAVKDPALIDIFREFFIDALIHCMSLNFCPFYAVSHPDYEFNKIPVIPQPGKWSCKRFTDNKSVWWEFQDVIDDTTIEDFPTMITLGQMIPFATTSAHVNNSKGFTGSIAISLKSLSEIVEHRESMALGARKAANPTVATEAVDNERSAEEEIERLGGGSVNEGASTLKANRLARQQELQDQAARERAREMDIDESDQAEEDMLVKEIERQEAMGINTSFDGVPNYCQKFINPAGGSRAALRNPMRRIANDRKIAPIPSSNLSAVSVQCVEQLLEGIARLLSIPLDRLRGTGAKLSADVQTAASEMNETYEAVLTHVRRIANMVMPFVDEESYELFALAGVKPDVIIRMNSTAPSAEMMRTYMELGIIDQEKANELIATQHNWPSSFMKIPTRPVCDMIYPEKPDPVKKQ